MKGLWKYLSPFAPDQSGACAVLYDLGGIIIICDAGGCAGNVCGFDEPRWFTDRSAIFSAGLRDMDAVFGRDEQLVDKLISAYDDLGGEAEFAAIVGTPVPAVIGTDYFALKRLAKKKSGLTIITVDTNGMELYDEGAAKAYMSIVEEFALDIDEAKDLASKEAIDTDGFSLVLGNTPLDVPRRRNAADPNLAGLKFEGSGSASPEPASPSLVDIKLAALSKNNIVTSPSGLPAARYLKERFGTDYECGYPFLGDELVKRALSGEFKGKKVLIIHQLIATMELRNHILQGTDGDCRVDCATWFSRSKGLVPDDITDAIMLREEDDLIQLAVRGGYDHIIADAAMKRALRSFEGEFISFTHFAVSGKEESHG